MASPEIGPDGSASGLVDIRLLAFLDNLVAPCALLDNLVVLVGVGLPRVRRAGSLLGHARVYRPRMGEQVLDLPGVLWYGVGHELDRRGELHAELFAHL